MTSSNDKQIEARLARGSRADAVDDEGRGLLHFARFGELAARAPHAARRCR